MKPNASSEPAMVRLALATAADADQMRAMVRALRALPEVLGVRADFAARQMEIFYRQPAELIVERIHRCLAAVRQSLTARQAVTGSSHASS